MYSFFFFPSWIEWSFEMYFKTVISFSLSWPKFPPLYFPTCSFSPRSCQSVSSHDCCQRYVAKMMLSSAFIVSNPFTLAREGHVRNILYQIASLLSAFFSCLCGGVAPLAFSASPPAPAHSDSPWALSQSHCFPHCGMPSWIPFVIVFSASQCIRFFFF